MSLNDTKDENNLDNLEKSLVGIPKEADEYFRSVSGINPVNSSKTGTDSIVNFPIQNAEKRYRSKNSESNKNVFSKGDVPMENDKILELYINKVDKDQYELKQDVRDSEKRIENHIIQSEKRMDDRLNRIEELIASQNTKFEKMDDKIVEVGKEVSNKLEDYRKFQWGIAISIFLAIAAMIVSIIVS